jgi:ribosomal protein S18 acetylase RimI-like enzyme
VRGWLYHLAVAPEFRKRGFASQLVRAAESALRALGCAKINLQIRNDNGAAIAFYRRLGVAEDASISMGKRLERDDA